MGWGAGIDGVAVIVWHNIQIGVHRDFLETVSVVRGYSLGVVVLRGSLVGVWDKDVVGVLRVLLDEGIAVPHCGIVWLIWRDEGMMLWLCRGRLAIWGR